MTSDAIASLDQLTAEWLTGVLVSSGALKAGSVASYEMDPGRGNWSTGARLKLDYAARSEGAMPGRLFLKMVETDASSGDEFFGESEVTYYTRDYVGVEAAPLVLCYSAAYSADLERYHLLLDDHSETHVQAAKKTPTLEYGLALAEGLATLHAHWWGGARLAEAGTGMHDAQHIQRFVDIAEPGVEHIVNSFSAELEPHWPEMMRDLYAEHPRAIIARTQDRRTQDDNGFTLIHGDVGDSNILVPRQGDRPIYIIDRQPFNWSLTAWLGVYDVAYAIVLDWPVEIRRRLEMPVLRHYHEWLLKNGVAGYPWERLYDDYRLTAAMGVYIATEYCRGGINERWLSTWLPYLKRSLIAIDDLNIEELWKVEG